MVDPKLGMEWWLTGWIGRGVVHKVRHHFSWYFWHPPPNMLLCYTSSIFDPPPPLKSADVPYGRPQRVYQELWCFWQGQMCFYKSRWLLFVAEKLDTVGNFWLLRTLFEQSLDSFFIFCKMNQINCSHYNKYSWIILRVLAKYMAAISSQVSLFMWYVGIFT